AVRSGSAPGARESVQPGAGGRLSPVGTAGGLRVLHRLPAQRGRPGSGHPSLGRNRAAGAGSARSILRDEREPAAPGGMSAAFDACPFVDAVDGVARPIGNDAVRAVPPLGVYQLASVARAAGHDVTVADLTAAGASALSADQLAGVDVVCLSATTMSWPVA